MENIEWAELIFAGFMGTVPGLIVWVTAFVIAVRLLRRGGGKAERLLLIGASVCIFGSLFYIPQLIITPLMFSSGSSAESALGFAGGFRIVGDIVNAAGLICFIYAFWVKFKAGRVTSGEFGEKEGELHAN